MRAPFDLNGSVGIGSLNQLTQGTQRERISFPSGASPPPAPTSEIPFYQSVIRDWRSLSGPRRSALLSCAQCAAQQFRQGREPPALAVRLEGPYNTTIVLVFRPP